MVGDPRMLADRKHAELQATLQCLREGRVPCISDQHKMGTMPSVGDLVITPCEVNEFHGTGTLLLRIFKDWSSIVSLRTNNFYEGVQEFGTARFYLPLEDMPRPDVSLLLRWHLNATSIRRIVTIPYSPAEAVSSIVAKEIFNVPLCAYIMDDKNVCANGISDSLMYELFSKSHLRLVIGPEMKHAYEKKYQMTFWIMPPLVPQHFLKAQPVPVQCSLNNKRGVLLGNIWGQRWLDMLRRTFRGTDYTIDWFCNGRNPSCLEFERTELERDGIRLMDSIAEADLPKILSNYAFAVVPSDTLDGKSPPNVQAIAELSLPSRIPTMVAASHLPILLLGSPKTSAARFVTRFQLGFVAPYESVAVRNLLDQLSSDETQVAIRERATTLAWKFTNKNSADWIWQSLNSCRACDNRYEELFANESAGAI